VKLKQTLFMAALLVAISVGFAAYCQQTLPVSTESPSSHQISHEEESRPHMAAHVLAGIAHYRHNGAAVLNDVKHTPGAVDETLTKAKLCDKSFHTSTMRNVPLSEKRASCSAYGISDGCPGKGFELDHLISIELGGSNDIANLWPQPVDAPGVIGFHVKDVVENRAHAAVCSGSITLKQAQDGISTDWYKFGKDNGFITQ
jgi:hypothetical protein